MGNDVSKACDFCSSEREVERMTVVSRSRRSFRGWTAHGQQESPDEDDASCNHESWAGPDAGVPPEVEKKYHELCLETGHPRHNSASTHGHPFSEEPPHAHGATANGQYPLELGGFSEAVPRMASPARRPAPSKDLQVSGLNPIAALRLTGTPVAASSLLAGSPLVALRHRRHSSTYGAIGGTGGGRDRAGSEAGGRGLGKGVGGRGLGKGGSSAQLLGKSGSSAQLLGKSGSSAQLEMVMSVEIWGKSTQEAPVQYGRSTAAVSSSSSLYSHA